MSEHYFKYKALSFTSDGGLDERSLSQVIKPISESYYYLPTREKLNDPNEGIFQNQIQEGITAFLQGLYAIGERNSLAESLYNLARQISQSTDNSGVFSLSSNAADELMWAHYGSSHCGIAIEYNLAKLTRFSGNQYLHCFGVNYSKEPPILTMQHLQEDAREAVIRMLGHKSLNWTHEEEFRVLLENINGPVPHDYRAVKSLTFGIKVPKEIRAVIFEKTKDKVPVYYEIRQIHGGYKLERSRLKQFTGNTPSGEKCGIDWESHFEHVDHEQKERLIDLAKTEIEEDPHFEELYLADRSTQYPEKAVLQYKSKHHLGLSPWSQYTKSFYEL